MDFLKLIQSLDELGFAQHLRVSRWRAALHASRAMVEALPDLSSFR